MQLTCRRCQGAFTTAGAQMTPCPACGSIDVVARSPMAATAERVAPSFSAPVSQPVVTPSMPPPQMMPAAHGAIVPYTQPPTPSYPPPPPQYAQQPTYPQPPQYTQPAPYAQQAMQPTYPAYPQPTVNVVIQNQINPPYAPTPYAMQPYARRKDAGVATLLSFFLPGAGQLYNGQIGKGLAFLLVTIFVNFPLMFVGVGFVTGLATWIWAMIDAHSSAEKINRGEIVV